MKIFFLDQSGKLGGAELSLLDVAEAYGDRCQVGLFADGVFRAALEQRQIPTTVLIDQPLAIKRESGLLQSLSNASKLVPLINRTARISRHYDIVYTNTQKAFVVGAIASFLSRRPLVYHLRDILSLEHFSASNIRILITLANQFAKIVLCNSQATRDAFIAAGGRAELAVVVYNGFKPEQYQNYPHTAAHLRQGLGFSDQHFIIGHFSRLSPWKGQHVLIDALQHCPNHTVAILVGDALFGEEEYVAQLHQQVADLGLSDRVHFLGFRSDIPELMSACNLVVHASTSPEPFGRVIVEAMLCGTPVVAAEAGGAVELVEHGKTGWLCPPSDVDKLADIINHCITQPNQVKAIAHHAQELATQRFNLRHTNQQIAELLEQLLTRQ